MWLFSKVYYVEDWELVQYTPVKHIEIGLGHMGWSIRILLRNKHSGRSKEIKACNINCAPSLYEARDKLFKKTGLFLDIDKNTIQFPSRQKNDRKT